MRIRVRLQRWSLAPPRCGSGTASSSNAEPRKIDIEPGKIRGSSTLPRRRAERAVSPHVRPQKVGWWLVEFRVLSAKTARTAHGMKTRLAEALPRLGATMPRFRTRLLLCSADESMHCMCAERPEATQMFPSGRRAPGGTSEDCAACRRRSRCNTPRRAHGLARWRVTLQRRRVTLSRSPSPSWDCCVAW
jgi:hypothetical protein